MRVCEIITTRLPFLKSDSCAIPKTTDSNVIVAQKEDQLESLREYLQFVDSVSISTAQIVLKFEIKKGNNTDNILHNSITSLNFNLSTLRKKNSFLPSTLPTVKANSARTDHISEININITVHDYQLKIMYNSSEYLTLVNPLNFSCKLKAVWSNWLEAPYLDITFMSRALMIEMGPGHIFFLNDMMQFYNDKIAPKYNSEPKNSAPPTADAPKYSDDGTNDIIYQDDLRAGVFQYIDNSSANKEPRPYQVMFDNNTGTMVWCYPEPRALTRVDIHPVPFVAASSQHYTSRNKVACVLQFYDPLRADFVTYRQFQLSESVYCQLELPSLYEKQRLAVATTWRVWIDYSEDESGDLKPGGGHLLVPPAALAACMRVDSIFSINILPRLQFMVSLDRMELEVHNDMNFAGKKLPKELEGLKILKDLPDEHGTMTIAIVNTSIRGSKWTNSILCDIKGTAILDVMNYEFMTNNRVLEPTEASAKCLVVESLAVDKPRCFDTKVFVKPLHLHVSQSTVHSLSVCQQMWMQAFEVVPDSIQGTGIR